MFIRRDREMQLQRKLMEEEALSNGTGSGVSSPDIMHLRKQRAAAANRQKIINHRRQMTACTTLQSSNCGGENSSTAYSNSNRNRAVLADIDNIEHQQRRDN